MVDCLVRRFQIKNKNIPAMYPDAQLPQSLVRKIQDAPNASSSWYNSKISC